jgi:transcriptional regulator with XRE-family HTH domain
MVEFGKKLAEIRKERKLTQGQLAELLEIQPAVISRWENGVSKPQFDFVLRLAEVLEVSFDELLGEPQQGRERPKFEIRNRRLKELCRQVDRLDPQDQDVICHVMDSLIRKEQIKSIVGSRPSRVRTADRPTASQLRRRRVAGE